MSSEASHPEFRLKLCGLLGIDPEVHHQLTPQPPSQLSGKLHGAPGPPAVCRARRASVQLASTPAFSTHFSLESLEEIDQHLGLPCWLLSLLIVSVLLRDSQHSGPRPQSHVIGAGLSFHLRVLSDLPHSRSFCVTGVKWKTEKNPALFLRPRREQRHCCSVLTFVNSSLGKEWL